MRIYELAWGVSVDAQSMKEVLRIIKKYPFIKHVQIKLPGEPAEPRRLSRLKRAAEAAAQSGYSLSVHAYPHINLCEGIPALAQANLFLAQEALRTCYDIGGQFAVFHGGSIQGRGNPQLLRRKALAALAQALDELMEYAQGYNLSVHLENIYPAPFRSELLRLPSRREDFDAIADMADSPLLKFCYDYGHGMIDSLGGEMPAIENIGSFHLHENDCLNDLHLPLGGARDFPADWSAELNKIGQADFSGAVILENSPERLEEGIKVLQFIIEHEGASI